MAQKSADSVPSVDGSLSAKRHRKMSANLNLASTNTSNKHRPPMFWLYWNPPVSSIDISFKQTGYYTKTKDKAQRKRYLDRHRRRENWNAPMTAGALSRYVLWNKETRAASIADYKRRFKLK